MACCYMMPLIVAIVCLKYPPISSHMAHQYSLKFILSTYICDLLYHDIQWPSLVHANFSRSYRPMTSNAAPFTSLLTRAGTKSSGIPLIVATNLATSSHLHYYDDVVFFAASIEYYQTDLQGQYP